MDETIITIVILMISFFSWLFAQLKENKANQANKANPAKGAKPVKRPIELSNEIETFLQELSGKPKPKKKSKPVIIKSAPPKRKQPRKEPVSVKRPAPQEKSKTFDTNISNRHLEKKNYGTKLDQHVSSYIDRDIKEHVEEHISYDIGKSVTSHLGDFSKELSPDKKKANQPHPIISFLHDRESVAKAVILNEILSPPLSRRNKTS